MAFYTGYKLKIFCGLPFLMLIVGCFADPLLEAIKNDNHAALETLTAPGAQLDYTVQDTTFTPLRYAIILDKEWAARLLLARGANPDYYDTITWTPLRYSIAADKKWAVQLLLESHANPNYIDPLGWTPIREAFQRDKEWAAELLFENGVNLNENGNSKTPLRTAIQMDKKWAVQCLLSKGVDANYIDAQKWTPINYAIRMNKEWAVKLLLEHGANPEQRDGVENTPLIEAIIDGKDWAMELLLKYTKDAASPYCSVKGIVGDYTPKWKQWLQEADDDVWGLMELYWASLLRLRFDSYAQLSSGWRCFLSGNEESEVDDYLIHSFNEFTGTIFDRICWTKMLTYADPIPEGSERPSFLSLTIDDWHHRVSIGFYKHCVVFANRGFGIVWDNQNKGQVLGAYVCAIKDAKFWPKLEEQIKAVKNGEDWNKLRTSEYLEEKKILSVPPQKTPNCPFASPEMAIFGLVWLQARWQGISDDEVHFLWKNWVLWDHRHMLQTYLCIERIKEILSWGIENQHLKRLYRQLEEAPTTDTFLEAVLALSEAVKGVDRAQVYNGMQEAISEKKFGNCTDTAKVRSNVDRILTMIPKLATEFSDYVKVTREQDLDKSIEYSLEGQAFVPKKEKGL